MWLSYLKRTWPQAAELHAAIRRLHDPREILEVIERALGIRRPDAGNPRAALGSARSGNASPLDRLQRRWRGTISGCVRGTLSGLWSSWTSDLLALPHRPHLSPSSPLYAGLTYVADHFPRRADPFGP